MRYARSESMYNILGNDQQTCLSHFIYDQRLRMINQIYTLTQKKLRFWYLIWGDRSGLDERKVDF